MRLIGLDFETSATDIDDGAVPIQLGLAYRKEDGGMVTMGHLIGGWDFKNGPAVWDENSAEVHGYTRIDVAEAEPAWKVDIRLAAWLLNHAQLGSRMWNLPVGWNVGGFDMPFIRRWFPNLSRMLSYRSVDLTPLVIALSQENEQAYKQIKATAKAYAAEQIGGEPVWHDAAYDAGAALYAYEYLTRLTLTTDTVTTWVVEDR